MTNLRKGDTVTFRAVVTDVADYNDGQHIMAKVLPNGSTLGWCLPNENAFTAYELNLEVGDRVRHKTNDDLAEYEVMAIFPDKQVAIRKVGNWPIQITALSRIQRT